MLISKEMYKLGEEQEQEFEAILGFFIFFFSCGLSNKIADTLKYRAGIKVFNNVWYLLSHAFSISGIL